MKSTASHEKGQALVIIVVSLIGLLGMTALAVDGGNAYAQKLAVQNAADTAALGGALARIRDNDWVRVTYKIAATNGYNNDRISNFVKVYSPPISGVYAGDINYIQVQITSQTPTYFAKILGITQIPVSGEAVTRTKRPEITEILEGNAVISLAPTSDCVIKKSFDVSGESTLDIEGGGVFVNSNNPTCALSTWGNGSIRLDEDETISAVGGAAIQKPQLLTPYPPLTGAAPISYPPPFILPKVNCDKDALVSEDGLSMRPGDWGDDVFPPEGVVGLQPGMYCLGGDFIVNGALEGHGVVILVSHGQVHLGGTIKLSAPNNKKNKNNGLLLYLPPNNQHIVSLNGDGSSSYKGTILAPGSQIRLKGNESAFGFHSQIIGYSIMSDGMSNIFIKYKDDENYDALTMPEIEISQ
jgi:hypothetical protein